MRMRYPRHLNIGLADSTEGSCELKWCHVSQQILKEARFYLGILNHGVIRQDCQSWYIRHVYVLVYLHVFVRFLLQRCMFEPSALRVGVKTLRNTQCQLVV